MKRRALRLLITLLFFAGVDAVSAQGTAFTYQGRLLESGSPANGIYDLTFSLLDAGTGGSQVGGTVTNSATVVSNGLFTVTLDFGANFPGADRWLEIGVRTNGGGAFTTLASRQKITPTPYASYSANAGSAAAATTASSAGNFTGSLSGDVTGTQGATVVANVGGQSAANVSAGVSAANAARSDSPCSRNSSTSRGSAATSARGCISLPPFRFFRLSKRRRSIARERAWFMIQPSTVPFTGS